MFLSLSIITVPLESRPGLQNAKERSGQASPYSKGTHGKMLFDSISKILIFHERRPLQIWGFKWGRPGPSLNAPLCTTADNVFPSH